MSKNYPALVSGLVVLVDGPEVEGPVVVDAVAEALLSQPSTTVRTPVHLQQHNRSTYEST